MSEQNKQTCRRLLEEAWNKGLLAAVDATVSRDCRFHDPAFPSIEPGAESYKRHIQECRDAFPDLSCSAEDIIAEQNEVVIHWTVRGTHRGKFLGMDATGRSMMISGTSIHRLEKDKIVELWADWNLKSLQDQLGLGMTEHDANKAFARRFVEEIWNRKKPETIGQFVTDDYTRFSPNGTLRGAKGLRQEYDIYTSAFPDCHIQIEDVVCEGDRVALRFTASGTQTGKFMEVAASGKPVKVQGTAMLRIANGKVAEEYAVWDTLGLMQQIGAVGEFAGATRTQQTSQ
ncbi:MAG: ester cyclase [Acidobacteria bacterium]|nr:ester cyclase [Acidobacteriota bacterium]